jgi:hypothetical protein
MRNILFTTVSIIMSLGVIASPSIQAAEAPDTIVIRSLSGIYGNVSFNHAKHITFERDCAICHHHTNGAPATDSRCIKCHRGGHEAATMACPSCHSATPYSAAAIQNQFRDPQRYHQDKPGLKSAYHLSCLGCHEKQGGPTGCGDCHQQTTQGQAFYRSGPYAPKSTGKSGHGSH